MEIAKAFRGLVASFLVLIVLGATISIVEPELPEGVSAYLEGDGAGPLFRNIDSRPEGQLILLVASALVYLIAFLAACIGLLMFKRWARATYIGTTLIGLAFTPLLGATFYTPLWSTINTLTCMCQGAIFVMLLFDPIKAKFAEPTAPA